MRGLRFRHPYLWGRDHPLVVDTLIALVIGVFGVLTEVTNPGAQEEGLRDPNAFSVGLTVLAALALVARRRHPLTVVAVVWPIMILHTAMEFPGGGPILAALFALYAVAAHARTRRIAVRALVVTIVGDGLLSFLPGLDASIGDVISIFAFVLTAWVLGDNMRMRRAQIAAVEEKAERLERDRDVDAQRAVTRERARIARELHDVVAHSMSVMVVQAGAARRTLDRDPERATEALTHIESVGRDALDEMRRLVGVLRSAADAPEARPAGVAAEPEHDDEPAARLPQPSMGEIPTLIQQCREAGLDVTVRVDGEQRPLPSGVELVVYRIVQEALTNTMKHAGQARAVVRFFYRDDTFSLIVADDGRGAAARRPTLPGHGLTGMRERVALYGGGIAVGPQTGGGFRVWVELPLDSAVPTVSSIRG